MSEMKSLDYKENYEGLIPEGAFRISPSMLSKFSDRKWEWYQSQVLGNETFSGNTSTVLGTCVHRAAETLVHHLDKGVDECIEIMRAEIPAYIKSHQFNPEVDTCYIEEQWEAMSRALMEYLLVFGVPDTAEGRVAAEVIPDYYIGGTYDAKLGTTLIDFKTTSRTTAPTDIPYYYKTQLLAYAYALRKSGINIEKIRIVWITNNVVGRISEKTGKPMKDYPSQVTQVTEFITDDDMKFIEDYLKLVAESVASVKSHPAWTYLVFGDYRLKDNPTKNLIEKENNG